MYKKTPARIFRALTVTLPLSQECHRRRPHRVRGDTSRPQQNRALLSMVELASLMRSAATTISDGSFPLASIQSSYSQLRRPSTVETEKETAKGRATRRIVDREEQEWERERGQFGVLKSYLVLAEILINPEDKYSFFFSGQKCWLQPESMFFGPQRKKNVACRSRRRLAALIVFF